MKKNYKTYIQIQFKSKKQKKIMQASPQQQNLPHQNPQLQKLIEQQIQNIMNDNYQEDYQQQFSYQSNVYFDKQLTHLVISQQFCFKRISEILGEVFKNYKIDTSQSACRLRWAYIYRTRQNIEEIKEKEKQDKRIRSVAAFTNPYSLYSVDQLIQNLEQAQKQKGVQVNSQPKILQPVQTGYNIFKDSFRKIDNLQQYHSLQAKMKQALKKAQQNVYDDAPLYFTPKYDNLQQFQVKSQELTAQKARQLMSYQIQMQKISRELQNKREQAQQQKYEKIIKNRLDQMKNQNRFGYMDDDEQDDYESD